MAPPRKKDTLQYVRHGQCDEIFTTRVGTGELIFEGDHFLQKTGLIPISDLHDVLHNYEAYLCIKNQEPRGEFSVGVDRQAAEALIVSSVLVQNPTQELMDGVLPDHTKLAWAVKNNLQAQDVAQEILKQASTDTRFSMNQYLQLLSKSENTKLTEDLLQVAGPSYPEMYCNDKPLNRLCTKMPGALPAVEMLSFKCLVLSVNSRDGAAVVRITAKGAGAAQELLKFLPEIVTITFGSSYILKTDLLIAQYYEDALWLSTTAHCPTSSSSLSRKQTRLEVMSILHEKTNSEEIYLHRRRLLQEMKSSRQPV